MANASDPRCVLSSESNSSLCLPQNTSALIVSSQSQLPENRPSNNYSESAFDSANTQEYDNSSQAVDQSLNSELVEQPPVFPPSSPPRSSSPNNDLRINVPTPEDHLKETGTFTAVPDAALDLCADETLTALERLYVFSNSTATFHRAYISRSISSYLPQVTASEAVEYVLPLMGALALDEDEHVKEALIEDLANSIWWFLTNCQIVDEEPPESAINQDPPLLSVQAFTPLLGTLLLNPSSAVGTPARYVVTNLLDRMWNAMENDLTVGYFGAHERRLFRSELVHQIVIGLGHLDSPVDQIDAPMANLTSSLTLTPISMEITPPTNEEPVPSITESTSSMDITDSLLPLPDVIVSQHSPTLSPVLSDPDLAAPCQPLSPPSVRPPPISLPDQVLLHPTDANLSPSGVSPPLHVSNDPMGVIPAPYRALAPEHLSGGLLGADETAEKIVDDSSANDQGAIGRLASMSLMAAVTANSMLTTQSREAFVTEVTRVSTDSVYWVRREATFALGALAKIVPEEVVIGCLLPMFENFCQDSVSHVRQSVLFALPAILSRLSSSRKRAQALKTIIVLSRDSSAAVRSGVLEVLGEVIYTFHEDELGPPDEIVRLFFGEEGKDWHYPDKEGTESQTQPGTAEVGSEDRSSVNKLIEFYIKRTVAPPSPDTMDITASLIRAFNFPAVALTLGSNRWGELRKLYAYLAQHSSPKVRRTLAASIGEMARLIGPINAREDLLSVWWDLVGSDDETVRMKVLECLVMLVQSLESSDRKAVIGRLEDIWTTGICGWREREILAKKLGALAPLALDSAENLWNLLKRSLNDDTAAVRDAGVFSYAQIRPVFANNPDRQYLFHREVQQLAFSESYRHRVTYLRCKQAVMHSDDLFDAIADGELRHTLMTLSFDKIVDVRVGVARLLGTICVHAVQIYRTIPEDIQEMMQRLACDISHDVRSFVSPYLNYPDITSTEAGQSAPLPYVAIFSRPPPPPASPGQDSAQDEGMDDLFEFRGSSPMDLSSVSSVTGSPRSMTSSASSAVDNRNGDSGSVADSDISIAMLDCDSVDVDLYSGRFRKCRRVLFGSELSVAQAVDV